MTSMDRRYRVLLISEAANPELESMPLWGWSLPRALAKITDAHLVTHVRNRSPLIRAGLTEGEDFTAIDNEYIASALFKISERLRGGAGKGWTTLMAFSSLSYYAFEFEVWREFGTRIKAGEFDLVHRLTPKSPTSPSLLAKRLARVGVPFVLGPLGGGLPWPKGFSDRQHDEREWLSYVRWLYKLMPGYRSTRLYSSAIIAGTRYNFDEVPKWAKDKCVYMPHNGIEPERFSRPRDHSAVLPLKAAFIGRLVPYKGADMLLDAIVEFLRSGDVELHIIGDGPQRAALEAQVDALGVRNSVHFHGWLRHVDVQDTLRVCDFMAFPSIREAGGSVVVESMALGVTPIVADYGGPPEFIDEKTGIRVGFSDRQSLIAGMRRAIAEFVASPQTLDRMGAAARQKVSEKLTWDARAKQILTIYDAVLKGETNLSSLSYD